jgi:hypothetical protein
VLVDCTRPSSTAAFIVEIQTIWTRSDYNEEYVGTSSIPIVSSWSNYQLPKRSEYILISENNVDLICSRSDVFIKPEFGILANFDTFKPEEKAKIRKAFAKFMCSPEQ